MKISIILPVYNVEAYLYKCLDSLKFCLKHGHQLIIVNDGSTDESERIISDFLINHPKVIYVKQVNAGLSAARNVGLSYAKGDYIWFIDSDDYIDESETLKLFLELNNEKPDIMLFGRVEEFPRRKYIAPPKLTYSEYKSGQDYFITSINNGSFRTNVWDKIFSKSLLDQYKLKFEEGLIYEDMLFCLKSFMYSGKVCSRPFYPYHYIHYNPQSIGKQIRLKDLDVAEFINKAYDFITSNKFTIDHTSKEFNILIYKWVTNCIMHKYAFLSLHNNDAKFIFNTILHNKVFVHSVNYCSFNNVGIFNRTSALLLRVNPFLYKIALKLALIFRNYQDKIHWKRI